MSTNVRHEPNTYDQRAPPRTGSSSAWRTSPRQPVRSSNQSPIRRNKLNGLLRRLRLAEPLVAHAHLAVDDGSLERIHRTRRRAPRAASVEIERAAVARTGKAALLRLPV